MSESKGFVYICLYDIQSGYYIPDWNQGICLAANVKNKEKLILFPFWLCMSAFHVPLMEIKFLLINRKFVCKSHKATLTLSICQRSTSGTVKFHISNSELYSLQTLKNTSYWQLKKVWEALFCSELTYRLIGILEM